MLSRVRTFLIAVAVALGPLLYALGLSKGRDRAEQEEEARRKVLHKDRADFYREMEKHNAKSDPVDGRDDLLDRLYGKGL